MTSSETPRANPVLSRRKLARAMMVFGLVVIVAAVLYVLEEANGPGTGPKTFAQRRSYNQVKESVHATYPLALLIALTGLGITMVGARMQRAPEPAANDPQPSQPPPRVENGDHA